jgi:copper ion binding protein
MKSIEFKVEGITCGHCVKAVTNAITEVDGVKEVEVSLEKKSATVTFDDSKTSAENIKKAVNDTEIYKAL